MRNGRQFCMYPFSQNPIVIDIPDLPHLGFSSPAAVKCWWDPGRKDQFRFDYIRAVQIAQQFVEKTNACGSEQLCADMAEPVIARAYEMAPHVLPELQSNDLTKELLANCHVCAPSNGLLALARERGMAGPFISYIEDNVKQIQEMADDENPILPLVDRLDILLGAAVVLLAGTGELMWEYTPTHLLQIKAMRAIFYTKPITGFFPDARV